MSKITTFIISILLAVNLSSQDNILKTYNSKISFVSNAPLETIKASTKKLTGIINISNNNFSFRISMNTFEGFNNPLQKEHFFENYMEVNQYPESIFTGKIIEPINNTANQKLRAKGMLTIHGKTNEVLIDVIVGFDGEKLSFKSNFDVLLEDYDINVPKIVSQKISPVINVEVNGQFAK